MTNKEEVLAALQALSSDDRQWVLSENMRQTFAEAAEKIRNFAKFVEQVRLGQCPECQGLYPIGQKCPSCLKVAE